MQEKLEKKYLEILQWLVPPTIKKISAEYVGLESQAHKILHISWQGWNNLFYIQGVPHLHDFQYFGSHSYYYLSLYM